MAQTISAAVFFAYSIVYLLLGMGYATLTGAGGVGPGLFPRLLAVLLVALTAWNLVRQLVLSRRTRPAASSVESHETAETAPATQATQADAEQRALTRSRIRDAIVLFGFVAGYLLLMVLVGTLIPTFLFMLGVLLYFNRGKTLINVAVAVGITASIWLVFGVAFDADLPFGLYTLLNLP